MALLNQLKKDYYSGDDFGGYQFVSLEDIIEQFMFVYVGEDKIIPKISRTQVAFHAQRAMQELSFDTFKSCKAQEITLPPSLQMILPQDYVNYTKISWVDSAGVKHPLYPTNRTSNPPAPYQNEDGDFKINPIGVLTINSNIVVLDDDYSDLLVHGMRVVSPNLPNASYIHNVTTTGGLTSITLETKDGTTDKLALLTTNERLEITRFNYITDDFGLSVKNNVLASTTTTTAAAAIGDTQLNLTSVAGIEEGMFINHHAFVNDNTVGGGEQAIQVVGVGSSTVELSHAAVEDVASGDTVNFISNNKDSTTWKNYQTNSPSENNNNDYDVDDDIYDLNVGQRYGIDPQHAQVNGSFYIDCTSGKIHFSSNVAGRIVVLDYISDSLGTDGETQVHKFAEEAMYKWITHAVLASKAKTPEYLVARFKKERFAAIRNAKLRLSNIKLEEITQVLRGKSKQIKH
jgi:hypothetical protein